MNSLNFSGVSFFWIWAKCQARKMTTSSDIHSMIVLNVAFTVQASRARGARLLAPAAGDGDLAALDRGRRPRDRPEVGKPPISLGVVQPVADDEAVVLQTLRQREGGPVGVHVDLAVSRLVDEADHARLAPREGLADLAPQLVHAAGDLLFVEENLGPGQRHGAAAAACCSSRRTKLNPAALAASAVVASGAPGSGCPGTHSTRFPAATSGNRGRRSAGTRRSIRNRFRLTSRRPVRTRSPARRERTTSGPSGAATTAEVSPAEAGPSARRASTAWPPGRSTRPGTGRSNAKGPAAATRAPIRSRPTRTKASRPPGQGRRRPDTPAAKASSFSTWPRTTPFRPTVT